MAKFCGNCGTQLEDEAKVCGNCGMPVGGSADKKASYEKIPGVGETKPKNKKKIAGIIVAIIVVAVLIAGVVFAIKVIPMYTGYNGTIHKIVKAYESYDMKTLSSLTSNVAVCVDEALGFDVNYGDSVSDRLDMYENRVGHDLKITYTIDDAYEYSERKFDKFTSLISEYYDYDASGIEKIMGIELTLTVEGSKDKAQYTVNDMLLIKENGEWKAYYPYHLYN